MRENLHVMPKNSGKPVSYDLIFLYRPSEAVLLAFFMFVFGKIGHFSSAFGFLCPMSHGERGQMSRAQDRISHIYIEVEKR